MLMGVGNFALSELTHEHTHMVGHAGQKGSNLL